MENNRKLANLDYHNNERDRQDNRAVQKCIWGIHNSFNLEVNWLQQCKDILYVPPPPWAKIRRMRYLKNAWNCKFQSHGKHPDSRIMTPRMFRNIMFTNSDETSRTPDSCLFNTPTLRLFQTNLINVSGFQDVYRLLINSSTVYDFAPKKRWENN